MITIRSLRHMLLAIDSLDIRQGITSVIGPNGSGKTTLLRLCAGIDLPASGSILIGNNSPRNTEVGWVNEFPDRNILFETVMDEVASPLRFRRVTCEETTKRAGLCLERCGISRLRDRAIRGLSGGEKILVAFAAATVHQPDVLILDECDSHLDESRTDILGHLIRESAIPYVIQSTQQMEVAAQSDYVLYLDAGAACFCGTPPEVFSRLAGTPFYPLSWRCRA
ncbi:ATP-binding cassette domain-containing protein [Methanoregula sp.]|uniref:ATP-binding cassette domain-containing protein n=1 Tax=Methanoregula sp. TaxID=2052170 RepID=UPI003C73D0FF